MCSLSRPGPGLSTLSLWSLVHQFKLHLLPLLFLQGLKSQSRIKMNIVRCPPVTMVLIRRPDLRYQLGFSVQNGIVSTRKSLLRAGSVSSCSVVQRRPTVADKSLFVRRSAA